MKTVTQSIQIREERSNIVYSAPFTVYLWENSVEMYDGLRRPLIIICPGGGFRCTSDREADTIATQFLAMGYHAAVLRYSVAPACYPTALFQLAQAVQIIREHTEEWYIDTNRILVLGCSAGGHLAASLACFWNEPFIADALKTSPDMIRPNGQILCYPVITTGEFRHEGSFHNMLGNTDCAALREKLSLEHQVTASTPPAFIWNTYTDQSVPAENSILYMQALRAHNISVEYHLFSIGKHGIATATKVSQCKDGHGVQKECAFWLPMVQNWIENL